jgi:4-amino-4-deoxy-L-arabinose transferase-like glycosyltransferase
MVLEKLSDFQAPSKRLWWALLVCILAHGVLSWGVRLSGDEAHYALYAYRLDLSYYDHPPLVGWLQWPAVALGGTDVGLRVVPLLCWTLTAYLLWRLTGVFAQAQTPLNPQAQVSNAEGAVYLFMLSLLPHLLGLALVPDTLLLPLGLGLMWQSWRLAQAPHSEAGTPQIALREWVLLGLLLGLTGLSKYTSVLLVPGVIFTLSQAHGARWLKQVGPWCAALVALILVSPVFIWNAQHHWASFAYQLNHAGGHQIWQLKRVLVYAAAQVLVYGVLPLWALALALPALKSQGASAVTRVCLSFALPGLIVTLFLSGRGSALAHWTSWAWVCLLPLAGLGWSRLLNKHPRAVKTLIGAQGLSCVALMLALMTATPATPFADLHGWDQAALQAKQLAEKKGIQRLTVSNWSLASRLAWYARPLPLVVAQSHGDQYDLWYGRFNNGDEALWVNWSIMPFQPPVRAAKAQGAGFATCTPISQQPTLVMGREVSRFEFWQCQDWQGVN